MAKALLLKPGVFLHTRCRNNIYPGTNGLERFPVSDENVPWLQTYDNYCPNDYTSKHINGQPWADPALDKTDFKPQWNAVDGAVDRTSHNGFYELEKINEKRPLNPMGRTGLRGRGLLGRWGPNHAADPILTRWKRDKDGHRIINEQSQRGILQMIAIQRRDSGMWAIPGGMVDPGEKVTATLKREFMEEALDDPDGQRTDNNWLSNFFSNGTEVYRGYVDDHRNTDNAWMETVAYNYHDDEGNQVGRLTLSAGDDAMRAKWLDLDRNVQLFANHSTMVQQVVQLLGANW